MRLAAFIILAMTTFSTAARAEVHMSSCRSFGTSSGSDKISESLDEVLRLTEAQKKERLGRLGQFSRLNRDRQIDVSSCKKIQTTKASCYGPGLEGNPTGSGIPFDPSLLTAAHPTLPMNSVIVVLNRANGQAREITIADRGPSKKMQTKLGRGIDLANGSFAALGGNRLCKGVLQVEVYNCSAKVAAAAD